MQKSSDKSGTEADARPRNIWLMGMRPRTLTMAAVPVTSGVTNVPDAVDA